MAVENSGEHVFLWQIENFFYNKADTRFYLSTPTMVAEGLDSSCWRLIFFPSSHASPQQVAVYLRRCETDDASYSLHLDVEFCLIDKDGCEKYNRLLPRNLFQTDMKFGFDTFLHRDILIQNKHDLLPNNVLTLKCRTWKTRMPRFPASRSLVHTRIEVETSSFMWTIRDSRKIPCKRVIRFKDKLNNSYELQCKIVDDGGTKKVLLLNVQPMKPSSVYVLMTIKIVILSSQGKALLQIDGNHFFEPMNRDPWYFPSLHNSDVISQLEGDGRIDLSCEFTFSNGSMNARYCETLTAADAFRPDRDTLQSDLRSVYEKTVLTIDRANRVANADIMLKTSVGNKTFWAHKMILCARSSAFREILNQFDYQKNLWLQHTFASIPMSKCKITITKGRMTVWVSQGLDMMEISDMDPKILLLVLECIYTDAVNLSNVNEAILLYKASFYFHLRVLQRKSRDYLKSMISSLAFQPLLTFADSFENKSLWQYYINFISKNRYIILSSEEWASFSEENDALAKKVLDSLQSNID